MLPRSGTQQRLHANYVKTLRNNTQMKTAWSVARFHVHPHIPSAVGSQSERGLAFVELQAVSQFAQLFFCPCLQLTLCLTSISPATTARPSWLKHQQHKQQHWYAKSRRKNIAVNHSSDTTIWVTSTQMSPQSKQKDVSSDPSNTPRWTSAALKSCWTCCCWIPRFSYINAVLW